MFFRLHEINALKRVDVIVAVHAQAIVFAATTSVEDLQVGHLKLLADLEQFRSNCWIDD